MKKINKLKQRLSDIFRWVKISSEYRKMIGLFLVVASLWVIDTYLVINTVKFLAPFDKNSLIDTFSLVIALIIPCCLFVAPMATGAMLLFDIWDEDKSKNDRISKQKSYEAHRDFMESKNGKSLKFYDFVSDVMFDNRGVVSSMIYLLTIKTINSLKIVFIYPLVLLFWPLKTLKDWLTENKKPSPPTIKMLKYVPIW